MNCQTRITISCMRMYFVQFLSNLDKSKLYTAGGRRAPASSRPIYPTEFLQGLRRTINQNYLGEEAPIVMHGTHINGIIEGIDPTYDPKYLNAQVYIFGREGFVEAGSLLDMYQKYLLPR